MQLRLRWRELPVHQRLPVDFNKGSQHGPEASS